MATVFGTVCWLAFLALVAYLMRREYAPQTPWLQVPHQLLYRLLSKYTDPTFVCSNCGTASRGKKYLPGSVWITVILVICCIVPGVIYSIWRHSARRKICTACGSPSLVPIGNPVGRELLARHTARK